jgi:hypothetical protein
MVPDVTPLVLNPAPVIVTPEIVTFEFPLFVSVAPNELLLPTFTFPKLRLVGLAASKNVAATPVPVKGMAKGELGALLSSETEPVALPEVLGAKTALNAMLFPAAIVVGTARPVMLKPGPETFAWEIVRLALPELVNVMVCVLGVAITTFPKPTLAGTGEI